MNDNIAVIGFYRTPREMEAAVDELLRAGFRRQAISALHPQNSDSRKFARKKMIRPPKGTIDSPGANDPLDGTYGLTQPGRGPVRGALPDALHEIGLPSDWPGGQRVVSGEILLSVLCNNPQEVDEAKQIFRDTRAEDVDTTEHARELTELASHRPAP